MFRVVSVFRLRTRVHGELSSPGTSRPSPAPEVLLCTLENKSLPFLFVSLSRWPPPLSSCSIVCTDRILTWLQTSEPHNEADTPHRPESAPSPWSLLLLPACGMFHKDLHDVLFCPWLCFLRNGRLWGSLQNSLQNLSIIILYPHLTLHCFQRQRKRERKAQRQREASIGCLL